MSLREEMWKYEQITGESAEHVPIIKLGAFLDGYEMGLKASEQQPCEDCISREAVIQIIENKLNPCTDMFKCLEMSEIKEDVEHLPSVTPQPKTGHWINIDATHSKCDRCYASFEITSANGEANFCPNCGAKMVESEEEQKAVNELEKSTHIQTLNAVTDWLERDFESEMAHFKRQKER